VGEPERYHSDNAEISQRRQKNVPSGVKFYLNGGGLFTVQGRWWDEKVETLFGELGAGVYNPWWESKEGKLRAKLSGRELQKRVFVSDRDGVDVSQGIIMLGEGAAGEVSSGTAWETGYGYARDKLVLCMRTDLRGALNPLLRECLFDGKVCKDLDDLRDHATRAIAKIRESKTGRTFYDPPARPRKIRRVFLTAPYFTAAEAAYAKDLVQGLSSLGLDVMFPPGERDIRASLLRGRGPDWSDLFEEKVRCLDECDAVVALLEGADCGSEIGWDCGYGYSKYKPVFGMRTDLRSLGDLGGRVNLMLEQSIIGSKLCASLGEMKGLLPTRNKGAP
jgi:nucleoside 2-deoxyribosyltransferase